VDRRRHHRICTASRLLVAKMFGNTTLPQSPQLAPGWSTGAAKIGDTLCWNRVLLAYSIGYTGTFLHSKTRPESRKIRKSDLQEMIIWPLCRLTARHSPFPALRSRR
jgi:hypothetical protein